MTVSRREVELLRRVVKSPLLFPFSKTTTKNLECGQEDGESGMENETWSFGDKRKLKPGSICRYLGFPAAADEMRQLACFPVVLS